ncbi:hypothetical protein [Phocaeicola oris]|uniref:hypothetical protein n=1 Tax=Phocaeicola oris TaxID=2896850 RepID=UPI00234E82C0|nr:hypothetical protein [Phocaeicola oris]MCE2615957.1 hypothetical protein [Phocaeicola oris]
MKKIVLTSLLMMSLPILAIAQDVNDDLYFIPKKNTETKSAVKTTEVTKTESHRPTTNSISNVYNNSGANSNRTVINDRNGYTRDVDEYNRRYTSRDNNFSMDNDTLYIEEKPVGERGEWVNGFEGSQSDYDYAMRIVRFHHPRFAVPISSPLYWDMIYMLPSWEWNVYVDDFYAYAFPTYTNRLWWDWRYNYGWGWGSPWYYSSWYSTPWHYGWYDPWYYGGWYGSWYSGWYGGWGSYWGWSSPYYYHYAGWGHHGYWGGWGWNGSSKMRSGIHSDRYVNNYRRDNSGYTRATRFSQGTPATRDRSSNYSNGRSAQDYRTRNSASGTYTRSGNYSGRVVSGNTNDGSVRSSGSRSRTGGSIINNGNSGYTRSNSGTYNRPSSTRSSVGGSYSGAAERGAYSRSSNSGGNSRSYSPGVPRSSNNSSGYSRSSSGSFGSSTRSSGGSFGSSRSSGGSFSGGSRSSGGGSRSR